LRIDYHVQSSHPTEAWHPTKPQSQSSMTRFMSSHKNNTNTILIVKTSTSCPESKQKSSVTCEEQF
jgi:hypothetical protein